MKSFKTFTKNKDKSTAVESGFHKDKDGNVFISHSTTYDRNAKKDKKKDTNESILDKVKSAVGMKADHEKSLDEHVAGHNKEDHSEHLSKHSEDAHKDRHERRALKHFKTNTTEMNEHLIEAHRRKRQHLFSRHKAYFHKQDGEKHVHMDDFETYPNKKNMEKITDSEAHVHHTILKHSKPLGKKITLYHGSRHDFGAAAKKSKDGIVHNPAHMSTSHDHHTSKEFGSGHVVVVHADKHTKAVHIDGKGSQHPSGEKETVLPAGTKLKHIKSHKTSDGYNVHHFKVHSQQNHGKYYDHVPGAGAGV
jgi:hypothetical protein